MIGARFAWVTQESPSLIVCAAFCWKAGLQTFLQNPTSFRTAVTALFLGHYTYRALYYPTQLKKESNKVAVSVWLMAIVFCIWNGTIQGYLLAYVLPHDSAITPAAAIALGLQAFFWCNVMYADNVLLTLRKPGQAGYYIPRGGMFHFCSAGNYASEILEWTAYACAVALGGGPIMALAPFAFAWFAFCNLAPRGWQHHLWYLQKFKEAYPQGRKAVVPFLW